MHWAVRGVVRGLQAFATPPEVCAAALAAPLLRDSVKGGFFLQGPKGEPAVTAPGHEAARESIWRSTLALLQRVQ
jgi:hypothetical protein